jgi:hypothetical protein
MSVASAFPCKLDILNILISVCEFMCRRDPSPAAAAAWKLLDQLPPGALIEAQRFMLGGNLVVALDEATKGRLP